MESQPQNPEFRNNPKNFNPCITISCADPYDEPLYIYNNLQMYFQMVCLQNVFLLLNYYKYTKKDQIDI